MRHDLRDKTAIVTGAGSGLGRALTLELASRGVKTALAGRRPGPLAELAEEVIAAGGIAVTVPVDVTDPADRAELVARVTREWGGIDILINNAGIGRAVEFVEERAEDVIATNLTAPISLTREVIPQMVTRGSGMILNIASLGSAGLPFVVDYSASKAGLVAFSTSLREELRGTGVSVTAVSPGFMVDAGMYVQYRTPVPWYLGSNDTTTVARKAVTALVRHRSAVVVNKMPVRPLLVLQAISDRAFRATTRALGLSDYLKGLAAKTVRVDRATERRGAA